MSSSRLSLRIMLLLCVGTALPASAAESPPLGVRDPVAYDAKYLPTLMFTTKAYHDEALRLVLREANRVAAELRLPEKLPITESDLAGRFINPFGYARAQKAIGNVTTRNYTYYVSQDNKFSYLEGTHQDADCRRYQKLYTWPLSRTDTNQAYEFAAEWLAAISVDVLAFETARRQGKRPHELFPILLTGSTAQAQAAPYRHPLARKLHPFVVEPRARRSYARASELNCC